MSQVSLNKGKLLAQHSLLFSVEPDGWVVLCLSVTWGNVSGHSNSHRKMRIYDISVCMNEHFAGNSVAISFGGWERIAGHKPKSRFLPLGFLKPLYVNTSLCKNSKFRKLITEHHKQKVIIGTFKSGLSLISDTNSGIWARILRWLK